MPAAVLTIDINARLASLEAGLTRATSGITAAAKKMEAPFAGLERQLKSFGTTAAVALGVPLGVGELITALGNIKEKTAAGERSLNQLNAVLQATGNSAGLTARDLADIGKGVESKTIFDDEAIRAAETALLRFRSVQGDVFRQAIALAPDVAAALGTDLPTAAQALGRALSDPEHGMKALKAAGIQLSEQQKDMAARLIESGDKAGAQKIVIDELTKSVGGASEADNAGLYGASKRLSRSWEDLQKAFGRKIFSDQGEGVNAFTGFLDSLIDRLDRTKIKLSDLFLGLGSARTRGVISGLMSDVNSLGNALISPPGGKSGSRSASGKIGGITTPEDEKAAASAAEAARKEADDQAYIDQQVALKKRADGAAELYRGSFQTLKNSLDARQSALDFSYQRNEISSAAYYSKERDFAEANLQAQGKYIREQQEAQQALLSAPSTSREDRYAIEQKLIALSGQNDVAIAERNKKLQQINQQQALAVERLIDDYAALNIQLLEISGNTVEAANAAFILAHKDQRRKINAELQSDDPDARARAAAAAADLDRLQSLTTLQARLTDATKTYSLTLDEVSIAERNINSALTAGSITELDSLRAISDARAGKLGQLRSELAALEAIAAQSGKREDIIHAEELRARLNELAATGDLVAKKFNDIGSGAFSSLLQDLASGKGFKAALANLSSTLSSSLSKVFADDLAQKAFGKDGPLSAFGDIFSKLLGGGGGAGATAGVTLTTAGTSLSASAIALDSAAAALTASALGGAASSVGSGLGAFANIFQGGGGGGGDILTGLQGAAVGMPYVPRDMLLKVHRGERVVTASDNQRGQGRSVQIVQHINVMPGATTASAHQAARLAGSAVSREIKR